MKTVFAHHLGRTVKFGRTRPTFTKPKLKLGRYLDKSVLEPAPDCDYSTLAMTGLRDVLLNDHLACCTCSGVGHVLDVLNCNAGRIVRVTDAQVLKLYEDACNYDPNNPASDQGGDETTVLNYLARNGMDGAGLHQIVGHVSIDACDKEEVRWAMNALGNLYHGQEMPKNYVDLMPQADGFTWGLEGPPDPDYGHCFISYGSTPTGLLIGTWGLLGLQTYEAAAFYGSKPQFGEMHAIVTKEWLLTAMAKTPSGFAYDDLISDLAAIGTLQS